MFFIVGPTAVGKSELGADVAETCHAEIVSADAFQIYRGLDILSAKPDAETLARIAHHLIGAAALTEEMNAARFRSEALQAIAGIEARGKPAIVVGGSGLYVKALTHGFTSAIGADEQMRAELSALELEQLQKRLQAVDPAAAARVDLNNKRRVVRAIEIACSGGPVGRNPAAAPETAVPTGVFVFRDRDELYQRINRRVEIMFDSGVVDEVRDAGPIGSTASQMIGFDEIRELLAGKISRQACIATIQQRTRQYAKRQLTWFRRQTNFEPLNLSPFQDYLKAVEWISQKARQSLAPIDD
jgi:tRNA dimethylallyltransferase